MIIFSAIPVVGCGVYPRPKREGVKPSPTMAETMIMAKWGIFPHWFNFPHNESQGLKRQHSETGI